jgi:hypothetical protein
MHPRPGRDGGTSLARGPGGTEGPRALQECLISVRLTVSIRNKRKLEIFGRFGTRSMAQMVEHLPSEALSSIPSTEK